jgi:prophage maintenance system killer protein
MLVDSDTRQKVAEEMVRQYLNAYRLVQDEILLTMGALPEPYKELEKDILQRFFFEDVLVETCDGLEFCTKLLSGLIVNQALPNTNHRTSTYFLVSLLRQHGINVDLLHNANEIREYFLDSKHILKKGKRDFKKIHYENTRQFLVRIMGPDQSGKLGNMSAKSFIVSFSASSNDSTLA